jgi:folate-dependent tRNA-U54 methylase TrmFO/GidA
MQKVKKQLRFQDQNLAEKFLDCPMTKEEYIAMLKKLDLI